MTAAVGSFGWFARHEARLAWRDLVWLLSGGRPGRERIAFGWLAAVVLALHGVAWGTVGGLVSLAAPLGREQIVVCTAAGFLSWTLMLSQALESVTRVFYGRADLDLILSSPAPSRPLFAIRAGVAAFATTGLALFLVAPFIDILALTVDASWLAAYGVVAAMGGAAAGVAMLLALAMFRWIGPARTRAVAQMLAAVVGAGFVITAQVLGIVLYGAMDRLAVFHNPWLLAAAPGPDSPLWWPARAASGEIGPLAAVMAAGFGLFAVAIAVTSRRFGGLALDAASVVPAASRRRNGRTLFRRRGPIGEMRLKELRLLVRDPWLLSQTLMQILYLLPPAVMLWHSFSTSFSAAALVVPVVVMAAGQLAGGLAWLTISGEDAPDLVATAPIRSALAVRAKVEAVLAAVALPLAPLVAAIAWADPGAGVATAGGIAAAAASATFIQFLFRATARRSLFRRRHTASRVATFAEAFSSIAWAGAAGLWAVAGWLFALGPAIVALVVLGIAWLLRPSRSP